ncbi:hypothetical protein ACFLYH_03385, partial [Candidatus Dependentiae bacterium]
MLLAYLNISILKSLSLITTQTFYEFFQSTQELNNQNWAWIVLITVKSKNKIKLKKLNLQWNGDFLDTSNISASLYKKKHTQKLLTPIQKNFICDGHWNKKNQEITFELNKKIIAIDKYYLLLNYPKTLKSQIKSGSFVTTSFTTTKTTFQNNKESLPPKKRLH